MNKLKILHTADLHLDSPFEGLSSGKAALRRKEQRQLLCSLSELAAKENVDLVLLSGDLLDSENTYYETGEELVRSLKSFSVPVFISPGNHDFYSPRSPYQRLTLPENVHVFTENTINQVELPKLGVRVFGAAFTSPASGALLTDFRADKTEDTYNVMCIHGDVGSRDSDYNPISEKELAQSGMDYVALGHIHKASGLKRAGDTWYSWPGCPEGRGFDELGEKTVSIVELCGSECTLNTAVIATRKYEIMKVDVSGADALLAIHTQLPEDTVRDVYRLILTGETESFPDINKLYTNLEEFFFELQLKDETRLRRSVWDRAGEDTLRGLFLAKLRAKFDEAKDEEQRREIEHAARWGLAALDNMEEVTSYENQ